MKILVVDDDEFIHEVVTMNLSSSACEIIHAFNSAEAQSIVAEQKGIDLLITDIVMPGEDGTKLIRHVHDKMPHLPVLAMTGGIENAMDEYMQLAELYADFTVPKPLKKADFLKGMQTAIKNAEARLAMPTDGAEQSIQSLQRLIERCSN